MKFYRILPIHARRVEAPQYLVIAQYIQRDPDMLKFYQDEMKKGKEVVLDNGAFEFGTSMPNEEYLEVINTLKPTTVVLPDKYGDGKASLNMTVDFINQYGPKVDIEGYKKERNMRRPGLMASIWADNIFDWIENYHDVAYLVDVIAVPKHLFKNEGVPNIRVAFSWMLHNTPSLKMKPFHFLGVNNLNEIRACSHDVVKSCDTALASKYALRLINMQNHFAQYGDCEDFPGNFDFTANLTEQQENLSWRNQEWMEEKVR